MDYKIIEHGDEVYLEEIDNNEKETEQKEPETKELMLIKARKGVDEIIEADVVVSFYIRKDGVRVPGYLQIKEYKDGKIIYYSINTIGAITKSVNNRVTPILAHFGINKEEKCYYEIYRVIKSVIYGDYIIQELYKNGYIIYLDPESIGNFYYILYKELIGGKSPKDEYLKITQIDKINPYNEKDLTLFSNIIDRIRQKIEVKAIKR